MTDETAQYAAEMICGNRLPCPNPGHRSEPKPPVPAPSDEAVEVAADTLTMLGVAGWMSPTQTAERTLRAAYAIDLPRLLAEARAEGEAARTAEIERLREALDGLSVVARQFSTEASYRVAADTEAEFVDALETAEALLNADPPC